MRRVPFFEFVFMVLVVAGHEKDEEEDEFSTSLLLSQLQTGDLINGRFILAEQIAGTPAITPPPAPFLLAQSMESPSSVEGEDGKQSSLHWPQWPESLLPILFASSEPNTCPDLRSLAASGFPFWPSRDGGIVDAGSGYSVHTKIGKGAFGEVWRALNLRSSAGPPNVVLKRLLIESGGEFVRLSGLREAYFGKLFKGKRHISRYIEKFERKAIDGRKELWLVFHDEGYSLAHHLFQPGVGGALQPSSLWWRLKKAEGLGDKFLRKLFFQLVVALNETHSRNVTHRDVKLENVLLPTTPPLHARLSDFGSAVPFNGSMPVKLAWLYGDNSPGPREETARYRPPEAIADPLVVKEEPNIVDGGSVHRNHEKYWREPAYDMWSLGVLLLQVVTGQIDPLTIADERKRAKLQRHMDRKETDIGDQRLFMLLAALEDLCILRFQTFSKASAEVKQMTSCNDKEMAKLFRSKDPSGVGLPDERARHFLWRLLDVDPQTRISAKHALGHHWFVDEVADDDEE